MFVTKESFLTEFLISFCMTTQKIRTLPTEEKLRIMEARITPEILALLRQSQERVTSGEARFLDWDQVNFVVGRG